MPESWYRMKFCSGGRSRRSARKGKFSFWSSYKSSPFSPVIHLQHLLQESSHVQSHPSLGYASNFTQDAGSQPTSPLPSYQHSATLPHSRGASLAPEPLHQDILSLCNYGTPIEDIDPLREVAPLKVQHPCLCHKASSSSKKSKNCFSVYGELAFHLLRASAPIPHLVHHPLLHYWSI